MIKSDLGRKDWLVWSKIEAWLHVYGALRVKTPTFKWPLGLFMTAVSTCSLFLQPINAPNPSHRFFSLPGLFLGHHQFGLQPPERDLSVDIVSEYSPSFLSITSPTDWWTTWLSQRDRDCYIHESVLLMMSWSFRPKFMAPSSVYCVAIVCGHVCLCPKIDSFLKTRTKTHFHLLYFVGFFPFVLFSFFLPPFLSFLKHVFMYLRLASSN